MRKSYVRGREEGLKKGLEQGLEQGLERGREEGLEKGREEGLVQGMEQGLERGREQAAVDMARRMKSKGYSAEDIVEMTGLSLECIREL